MIHFYSEQVKIAENLIDAKSMYDDIKAANDLSEINLMISRAQPTPEFINAAIQLDRRIYNDYSEIDEMHKLASQMSILARASAKVS